MPSDQEAQLKEIRDHLDKVKQNKETLEQGLQAGNDAVKRYNTWSVRQGGLLGWEYNNDSYKTDVVTPLNNLLGDLDLSIKEYQKFVTDNPYAAEDEKVKALKAEVDQRVLDVVGSDGVETPGLKDQVASLAVNGTNRGGDVYKLNGPTDPLPQSISDWQKSPMEREETPLLPEEQRNVSIMPRAQFTAFNKMDKSTVRRFDRAFGPVADEAARNSGATGQNFGAEAKKIKRGLELAASGAYYDGYGDYAARNFGRDLVFGAAKKTGILSLVQAVHDRETDLQQAVDYLNANYRGKANSVARNAFNYLSARENLSDLQKPNGVESAQLALNLLKDQGLIVAGDEPGKSKIVQVDIQVDNALSRREDLLRNQLPGVESTRDRFGVTTPRASGGPRV